ncbi:MAG: hypothetical protein IT307_01220 [Chloroflexi bacterium]|nr:hypothetical protein [Chloroflexota bacterium]
MAESRAVSEGAPDAFYSALRSRRSAIDNDELMPFFTQLDQARVAALSLALSTSVYEKLGRTIKKRRKLGDYRINPYVIMTSASAMELSDIGAFAQFLAYSKIYAGLETSFGRSIEADLVGAYPIGSSQGHTWDTPIEKLEEFHELSGLSRESKARVRRESVWREVDNSCIIGDRRFLLLIKSGPNTINDTQVEAMRSAIASKYRAWLSATRRSYPQVKYLDVVMGFTYGTDRTTNNKEDQILIKLMDSGFEEEARSTLPGVLVDSATRTVRVYRRIGRDFWSTVGSPANPDSARFVFLEVLLSLAKALAEGPGRQQLGDCLQHKLTQLAAAIGSLAFPRTWLPGWVQTDFTDSELVWLAAALTSFYDEGA